jgi:hypothetical protein
MPRAMNYVVGSASTRTVEDIVIPAGLIHAVRDIGFAHEHNRATAVCGETVLAFAGSSFPAGMLYSPDDESCEACLELLGRA